MSKEAARTGGLVGLVFGLAWLVALPAVAQVNPDREACLVYRQIVNQQVDFCLAEGCKPTQKECDRLCRSAEKACTAEVGLKTKATADEIKGLGKQDQILCATADDPKACQSGVKSGQKDALSESREFRDRARRSCESQALEFACESACNRQARCTCPGGIVLNCP